VEVLFSVVIWDPSYARLPKAHGLLQRRHVEIDQLKYIGKESNTLEEVDSGAVHSSDDVYTEYIDTRRDRWETKIRPALKKIPLPKLIEETGLSRRMLIKARTGKARPHPRNRRLLEDLVNKITLRTS